MMFLLLLLLALPVQAGIIVISDSVATPCDSWANILRDEGVELRLMSQPGRTIRDFSLPRDLRANEQYRIAIYWLGVNDAYLKSPIQYVEREFTDHMHFLTARGYDLWVILPPATDSLQPYIWQVRTALKDICIEMKLRCRNVRVWDEDKTKDGIHPTQELQREIAAWMRETIDGIRL